MFNHQVLRIKKKKPGGLHHKGIAYGRSFIWESVYGTKINVEKKKKKKVNFYRLTAHLEQMSHYRQMDLHNL